MCVLVAALLAVLAAPSPPEATLLAQAAPQLPLPAGFVPAEVLWFDLNATVTAESLGYEEQLLAFVLQGIVNDMSLKVCSTVNIACLVPP
jgi:hypothetical protein